MKLNRSGIIFLPHNIIARKSLPLINKIHDDKWVLFESILIYFFNTSNIAAGVHMPLLFFSFGNFKRLKLIPSIYFCFCLYEI